MRRSFRAVCLACALLVGSVASASPKLSELVERLKNGDDFRVRVQAALELGRTRDSAAVASLVKALDDTNASVRAAAAAGLKNIGDKSAIKPLKAHLQDPSDAVRSQIKDSIRSLELEDKVVTDSRTKVLVKIGSMRNQTSVKSTRIETQLAEESRRKLAELPGIEVLEADQDFAKESKRRKTPVVLVSGQVQKLKAAREGGDIVYSASVEYILHTMPEQSIAAKVSGSATASLTEEEAKDTERAAELRTAVLEAAIASALRRAPRALLAAARL
jgi:TolA-binding protein